MSLLHDEEIAEIAEKVFEGGKIQVLNHKIGPKSDRSIGYLGKHLALTIDVTLDGTQFVKNLFIKTYNVRASGDDFIGETGIFQKEVDLYKILIEDIRKLVGEPSWCPKYYYSKKRVLVLEDLSEKGFEMADDKTSLDVAHLEAALRSLSSLHASSLLLEQANSAPLDSTYPQIFREILYDENKPEAPSRKWLRWQTDDLLVGIDHMAKYSAEEKAKIKDRFVDEIMRIFPLSKPSEKYKNVLVHGDVWSNNLLFRYWGASPSDCKFVDFQFSRYAPPAHDVMHLLHYSTNKTFRDEHELRLLRFYYENFKERVEGYDGKVQTDMTWDDFLESCREYKELALIQCLLSLHYLLGPATLEVEAQTYQNYEQFLSASRKDYMKMFFRKESYADKVTDAFEELINNYIIRK